MVPQLEIVSCCAVLVGGENGYSTHGRGKMFYVVGYPASGRCGTGPNLPDRSPRVRSIGSRSSPAPTALAELRSHAISRITVHRELPHLSRSSTSIQYGSIKSLALCAIAAISMD